MASPDYIGKDNPDGVCIGQSASSLINLYGVLTPIVQQTATAAGTDATTTQALANGIRTALINLGAWVAA